MSDRPTNDDEQPRKASLDTAISNLLEESRMLLPGTQTLFGFQLIVVFNSSFDRLSSLQQRIHVSAMLMTVFAIALLMAPAAYHRQVEPEHNSRRFLLLSSRLLAFGTIPLALAICAEIYLVLSLIAKPAAVSIGGAVLILAIFTVLWWVLPRSHSARRDTERGS